MSTSVYSSSITQIPSPILQTSSLWISVYTNSTGGIGFSLPFEFYQNPNNVIIGEGILGFYAKNFTVISNFTSSILDVLNNLYFRASDSSDQLSITWINGSDFLLNYTTITKDPITTQSVLTNLIVTFSVLIGFIVVCNLLMCYCICNGLCKLCKLRKTKSPIKVAPS